MDKIKSLILENKVTVIKTTVPNGILPSHLKCIINNVKLNNKKLSIHQTYLLNPDLYEHVPRGLSYYTLHNNNNITTTLLMTGLREIGTEDSQLCLNSNKALYKTALITINVDGIPAMFSGIYIHGEFYLTAGTLNHHIIFNCKKHIDLYVKTGEHKKNSEVIEVAYVVCKYWRNLPVKTQENLKRDLLIRKHTIICRVLNSNHFGYVDTKIDNNSTYVNVMSPNLIGITMTTTKLEDWTSLIAHNAKVVMTLLKDTYNLNIPRFDTIDIKDVPQKISYENNTATWVQGFLIFYHNQFGDTLNIVSHTSKWYKVIHIVREYTPLHKKLYNPQFLEYQFSLKLEKLNLLTSEELKSWSRLALSWYSWKLGRRRKKDSPFKKEWRKFIALQQIITFNGLRTIYYNRIEQNGPQ